MVLPAVLSIASAGLGFIGQQQSQRAANRAAINNYKYQVAARERNWFQTLSIWGAKNVKYSQDIDEGNLAAARGYTKAQDSLNKSFASAIQANESAFIKYLEGSGKLSAAGRTGRGVNRINKLDIGKLERTAGRQAWALTRSQEAFKENVESIRRAAVANKNNLYANVAFAPVADAEIPAPVLNKTSPFLALANAGLDAYSTYQQFKTPSAVDFNQRPSAFDYGQKIDFTYKEPKVFNTFW